MKRLCAMILITLLSIGLLSCKEQVPLDDHPDGESLAAAESDAITFTPTYSTADYAKGKTAETVTTLFLPSLFADGMVLQRNTPIRVFGKAPNGEAVSIDWQGSTYTVQSDATNGRFLCELPPCEAAEGLTLTVTCGSQSKSFRGVMVGEVILCTGQSNMSLPMNDTTHYKNDFIDEKENLRQSERIKTFFVVNETADKPQDDVKAGSRWVAADDANILSFSPLPYYLAEQIERIHQVPVGLILCATGATAIQEWLPASALRLPNAENSQFFELRAQRYNGMVYPLAPYAIGSMIFYLGESNAIYDSEDQLFDEYLTAYAATYRELFLAAELPIYVMELAGFYNDRFAFIRDVQRQVCDATDRMWLIPNYDLGNRNDIHPRQKQELAQRAYTVYAATHLNSGESYAAPTIVSTEIAGNTVRITYDCDLTYEKNYILGFKIAGSDKVFHDAVGRLTSPNTVEVTCDKVATPAYVRYWIKGFATGNPAPLNAAGMPIMPFNTLSDPLRFAGHELIN